MNRPARRHAAVIFDCDGVLIDSERIACAIDARELAGLGIAVTAEAVAERFSGVPYRDMYRTLEHEHGIAVPADYAERTHTMVSNACAEAGAALAIPGIHGALDGLGDCPKGVASSSSPEWLARLLGQTDLWRRFAPHVYSVVEVARGKPAPDLFLFAAARLGVAPARCLVVEDSVAGVQAAVAAGMTAFGFCGGGHCGHGHARRLEAAGAVATYVDMGACGVALRDALTGV
jgi:HAD superfamily hydrolase (TIGR01509 family)